MQQSLLTTKPNRPGDVSALIKQLLFALQKKSFLAYTIDKYYSVPADRIALFKMKPGACAMYCFGGREHDVCYSFEQIKRLVSMKQFFVLNNQFAINFNAIKDIEPLCGRRLIVNLQVSLDKNYFPSTKYISTSPLFFAKILPR